MARWGFLFPRIRKKVSNANSNYLIAAPVYNFTDLVQFKKKYFTQRMANYDHDI